MPNSWKQLLTAFAGGTLLTAVIVLIMLPPRGNPVELSPAPTESPIAVFISGEVVNPGLYDMLPGSRVGDLLDAAGGFSSEANQQAVNLAAPLKDGVQISIPAEGEVVADMPETGITFSSKQININTAEVDDLVDLPGIGNTKAAGIVNYRIENGDFDSIIDIMNVPGIGSGIYDTIKDLITVD